MNRMRRTLMILPLLLCLSFILWQNCQAKSSKLATLDRIEPPEGLEWMEANEEEKETFGGKIRRKKPIQKRWNEREEVVKLHVDRPYSLIELLNENGNNEKEEEVELGEPIPWFSEWERMVANEKRRKGTHQRMRKLNPAKASASNHQWHSASPPPRKFRNIREDQPCLLQRKNPLQHRTYPRSWEFPGFELSIPRQWDWRNVSGVNYCSPNRNQHIPVYCGGCWVFGTLGMLNDRFNVARKNRWPMTFLSPQEIIACNGRGSCNGGTAEDVFEHSKTVGLVEEGCNNYKAVNEKCTPFTRCGSCWPGNCFAIQNYTRYYIKDFGTISGRLQMMSEIHNRGPIACSVGCTGNFDLNYTQGIYAEMGDFPPNHIVSVSGWDWDEETKTEYWIVRNSWGDAWGEDGWFRIVTSLYKGGRGDQYNLGIERQCYFADPDVSNLDN